jgi:hypothetical protein
VSRRLADLACWLFAALSLAQFLRLALMHLACPVEIDYIEGVMMDQVVRVAHGLPLYAAPSIDYVPVAYMPLLTWLSALLARTFGPAFWEPRLLSLLASLATTAVCFVAVHLETRRAPLAAAAAGLFLMGYHLGGGGHYDIARPDAVMIALGLLAILVLRTTTGARGAVAAGLLVTAAFLAKQHAVWFAVGGGLHLLVNDRRRALPFAATVLVGCGGGYLLLMRVLGPWFAFYTWDVPAHWSHLNFGRITNYLRLGLFGLIGPMTTFAVLSFALPERPWRGRAGIWLWTGLAALGTGLMATLDPNAWRHVFMPTMAAFSILGPISLQRIGERIGAKPTGTRGTSVVLVLVLALQVVALSSAPRLEIPSPRAAAARAELLARLRAIPGRVILLQHGFFTTLAGKGVMVQDIGLGDIDRAKGNRLLRSDPNATRHVLDPLRAGAGRPALVTDMPLAEAGPLWSTLDSAYVLHEDWGASLAGMRPLWGYLGVPRYLYLPRANAAAAAGH